MPHNSHRSLLYRRLLSQHAQTHLSRSLSPLYSLMSTIHRSPGVQARQGSVRKPKGNKQLNQPNRKKHGVLVQHNKPRNP